MRIGNNRNNNKIQKNDKILPTWYKYLIRILKKFLTGWFSQKKKNIYKYEEKEKKRLISLRSKYVNFLTYLNFK